MKKEESVALQGFAVLMMLVPHFFLDVSIYPDNFFLFPEAFQRFAWMGRMCVGIFSFLSGYGMYQVLKKKSSFGGMVADCAKRLVRLYAKLFLVIILCVYLPRLLMGEEILISQLPGNLFGYNPVYNGAWWFVFQYLWFMILAPVLGIIMNSRVSKVVRFLLVFVLFAVLLFGKGIIPSNAGVVEFFEVRMQPTFLFIFTEGFVVGKMQEFEDWPKCWGKDKGFIGRVRCPLVGVVLCMTALVLRYLYSSDPNKVNADLLLVPTLCCGASLLFRSKYSIKNVLAFFGINSLYLWFVHILVYDRLWLFLSQKVEYWFVFYIILLMVSLGVSILLRYIEKIIKKFYRCIWHRTSII